MEVFRQQKVKYAFVKEISVFFRGFEFDENLLFVFSLVKENFLTF